VVEQGRADVKSRSRTADVSLMTQGTRGTATIWLTVAQVAERAGLDPADVRAAAVRREVVAVSTHPRAGGDWMFRSSDVDRWLAGR